MRAVIVIAVLFLGGFFFFGIYWPKHKREVAFEEAAAVVSKYREEVVAREADLETIVKTLAALELHPASPTMAPVTYAIVRTRLLRERTGLSAPEEPTISDQVYLDQVLSLVETGKRNPYDSERHDDRGMAESLLAPVAKMRYAVLLDTLGFSEPAVHRDSNLFTPGRWSAKAYFFDVPARKYIAGWTLHVESSASVRQGGVFQGGVALNADLERTIKDVLTRSVGQNVFGVR